MEQLSQTQSLKVSLSLDDDDENSHPNVSVAGVKRAFTMPASQSSKRRVVTEPKRGGFIAAKMKERERLHKAFGAIHQSEVMVIHNQVENNLFPCRWTMVTEWVWWRRRPGERGI